MALEATALDTIADIAEREAAVARGRRLARMRPLRRHRFDELVADAAELLRGIPFRPPKDPARALAFKNTLATAKPQARRLANRAAEHRAALRSLAGRIRGIEDADWSLDHALALELEPALLAMWIAQGPAAMPLLVRDGVLPSRSNAADAIDRLAASVPRHRGRPHDVDASFDAAVSALLKAFGWAARRHGPHVFRASLSNAAHGPQVDAGHGLRFVREAINILAPDVSGLLGDQAIAAAVRRIRETLARI